MVYLFVQQQMVVYVQLAPLIDLIRRGDRGGCPLGFEKMKPSFLSHQFSPDVRYMLAFPTGIDARWLG